MSHSRDPEALQSSSIKYIKRYFIVFSIIIFIIIGTIFFAFSRSAGNLILEQLRSQSRSLYSSVILIRQMVSNYGGIYVRVDNESGINPYLAEVPGVRASFRDAEGRLYALKNPATVTRELSALGDKMNLLTFKITSLQPINPANGPDAFEEKTLRIIEKTGQEHSEFSSLNGVMHFRYMAPLYVKPQCLTCHKHHGYELGDLRGAISISTPASGIFEKVNAYRTYSILSAGGVLLLTFLLLVMVYRLFVRDIKAAEERLVAVAVTDFLTGAYNRGYGFTRMETELSRARRERTPLTVALFDMDHFKQINDTHGHSAGDDVLVTFVRIVKDLVRDYDVVCRYGGEEFLLILPATTVDGAEIILKRICSELSQFAFSSENGVFHVTTSIGVATANRDESVDRLIARADAQLYKAKSEGRNCIRYDK